jgi:hypothetical protein
MREDKAIPSSYTEVETNMSYKAAPYNTVQYKSSHNSYLSSKPDLHVQIDWNSTVPYSGGCRGVELDFWRHTDGTLGKSLEYFQVAHTKNTGPPLASFLGYLLSYHLANPDHDPLFVTLCIKSTDGDYHVFPLEIENYLKEWFCLDWVYKPKELLHHRKDLVTSAREHGWPKVRHLRGKFVLCLSGNKKWKEHYANHKPRSRLCFADIDVSDDVEFKSITRKGHRVVANYNLSPQHFDLWQLSVAQFRRVGWLVRGYDLNSEKVYSQALSAGVNNLATDKITGQPWTQVGNGFLVSTI